MSYNRIKLADNIDKSGSKRSFIINKNHANNIENSWHNLMQISKNIIAT